MDIEFRTRRLYDAYLTLSVAVQLWGDTVGRRFAPVADRLAAAPTLHDLFAVRSLRVHPLRGDRAGYYSAVLHGRYRIVFTIEDRTLTIEEVSNHYDD